MKRANEIAKELGVTNKELVLFLKETFPELGITDPARHHGKAVSGLYLDDVVAKFKAAHGGAPAAEPEKAPVVVAPVVVETPKAPEPVVEAPKPAPVVEAPKAAPTPPPVPAKPAPAIVMPAPKPVVSAPPPVAPVVSRPAPVPGIPPRPAHAPATPPPVARPTPAPVATSSAAAPASSQAPVSTPPPVNAPRPAPVTPPPHSAPRPAPGIPPVAPRPIGAPPAIPRPAPVTPQAVARPAAGAPAGVKPALGSTPRLGQMETVKGVLNVRPPIVVRDFAIALQVKPFRLLSDLMEAGIFASLNTAIDEPVAIRVAQKYGFLLEVKHRGEAQAQPKKVEAPKIDLDDPKLLEPRPPVVCVLGHVDHGKTTLLDFYRKANVVSGEAGGITQRVGAYSVVYQGDKAEHKGKIITFIDTPGHAAFAKMRERGAAVTDIAVLVVAADDGFMPQTDEALKFAQMANVSLVCAINKADAKGANIDNVKRQMQQRNIAPEDWGGTVLTNPVSALKGTGMDELLESILLQAEIMELKANAKCPAQGVVVESQMETGRGPTASVIVKKGTLKPGDAFVCGAVSCRVRALMDDKGRRLDKIGPGMTALVMGWSDTPAPGAVFTVVKNAREAENQAEENARELKKALEEEADQARRAAVTEAQKMNDLDRLMSLVNRTQDKVLKVVLKADLNGTLEAVRYQLEAIKSSKVRLEIVSESVGPITPSDVNAASAAGAVIVAFATKADATSAPLLKRHNIKVLTHDIIYFLIDQVKDDMAELLDPELKENKIGAAEVRAIFPFGKNGAIAGCMVTEGTIKRSAKARLVRKGKVVHDSEIDTLKRLKDDAAEVRAGFECGAVLEGFTAYQIGDIIEVYEIVKVRAAL